MSSATGVWVIYTDGAARGNPGLAGAGAVVLDAEGRRAGEALRFLGEATNNVAEYQGLLIGLERARELGARQVEVRADSQLLVRQMLGEYRVKNERLIELYERAKELESGFDRVDYVHVPRAQNQAADRLANRAIDGRNRAATI